MVLMMRWIRLPRPVKFACQLLFLCLLVFYAVKIYYDLFPGYIVDERYVNSVNEKNVGRVKLETMCSDVTQLCFTVVDLIDEKDSAAKRAIYLHGFEKEFDSLVTLIPPKGMSAKNSDTRMWQVDHTSVNTKYVTSLVISPFVVGAFNTDFLNSPQSARPAESMLIVGLGGGAMDMFIHTKFPSTNITVYEIDPVVKTLAHKWFGVVDDQTRRTVVQDGMEAIKQASSRGEQHNILVIDACDSSTQLPCPTREFLDTENLKIMKSILKPMGGLVVNVLALQDEESNLKMVERQLLSVFSTCLSIGTQTEYNTIYTCLPYTIQRENVRYTEKLWSERRKNILKEFGFARRLHSAKFKIIRKR